MAPELTPEQQIQHSLVVAMGKGMLKGLAQRGRSIPEAEAAVSKTLDDRVRIAGQLTHMDLTDHPEEGRVTRLMQMGRLLEAVIYASTAKGQAPLDALNMANRQRDRLFASAKSTRGETDEQILKLATQLKASVLQGQLMMGRDFEQAHHESRQVEETCLTIARRLHEINQKDYPEAHQKARLQGVGQMFAASVTGFIVKEERQPKSSQAVLRDVYEKHTSLFASVQRVIERQMERTLEEAPRSLGETLRPTPATGRPATPAAPSRSGPSSLTP